MSQADEVREYAFTHYVQPARTASHRTVSICAGEICRGLDLARRAPNVCSALQSKAFLQLAGVKLLERTGPRHSTTTCFKYSISQSSDTADQFTSTTQTSNERPIPGPSARRKSAGPNLTVVIQCAASKNPNAGHLREREKPILFVARPEEAPRDSNTLYRHPDDPTGNRRTWRDELLDYNLRKGENPLGLLPAWQLYNNRVYRELVEAFGLGSVFILSAGWGLLAADFLTPNYDITFSNNAEKYKRRRSLDSYADLRMLPSERTGPVVFLGGKDYVGLFQTLTAGCVGKRIIFHNSDSAPAAHGCNCIRFKTTTRTNWHYQCAKALIDGALDIPD